MSVKYSLIRIFTSEEARFKGHPLYAEIVDFVSELDIAARCIVTKGMAGSYENGEKATVNVEVLMYNLPLKIEIILPTAELDLILPRLEEMVADGVVMVEDTDVRIHKAKKRLVPKNMRVRDIMTPVPESVAGDTNVSDVIRLLLLHEFNGVPVVDQNNHPVGMITQNDLVKRAGLPIRLGLLTEFSSEKVEELVKTISLKKARDIMSKPAVCVAEDNYLSDAVNKMLDRGLKRLPVIDKNGKLTGMLARIDVFKTISCLPPDKEEINAKSVSLKDVRFVKDVMKKDGKTVHPDTPIEDILKIVCSIDIQRVAVVDENERILGLISDRDLLTLFSSRPLNMWDVIISKIPFSEAAKRHKQLLKRYNLHTAANVMNTDIITISEESPIQEALNTMAEKGLKRLPVVDEDGKFKGMISRDSLLRSRFEHHPDDVFISINFK